jgi:hypothetical protein
MPLVFITLLPNPKQRSGSLAALVDYAAECDGFSRKAQRRPHAGG